MLCATLILLQACLASPMQLHMRQRLVDTAAGCSTGQQSFTMQHLQAMSGLLLSSSFQKVLSSPISEPGGVCRQSGTGLGSMGADTSAAGRAVNPGAAACKVSLVLGHISGQCSVTNCSRHGHVAHWRQAVCSDTVVCLGLPRGLAGPDRKLPAYTTTTQARQLHRWYHLRLLHSPAAGQPLEPHPLRWAHDEGCCPQSPHLTLALALHNPNTVFSTTCNDQGMRCTTQLLNKSANDSQSHASER